MREYNKFQLTRWVEYRKAEDERQRIEAIESQKREITKFWVTLFQFRHYLLDKFAENIIKTQHIKDLQIKRYISTCVIKRLLIRHIRKFGPTAHIRYSQEIKRCYSWNILFIKDAAETKAKNLMIKFLQNESKGIDAFKIRVLKYMRIVHKI